MLLGLHEIRTRAVRFAEDWGGVVKENAEAQTFWNEFLNVFGVQRRKVAVFEKAVEKFGGEARGRIDLFWPGVLLAEHKSAGEDLDKAYAQAIEYLLSNTIRDSEKPRWVLLSDFRKIRVYDLEASADEYDEFLLKELPNKVRKLSFIAGRHEVSFKDEDPINVKAVKSVGNLHRGLVELGFAGHDLEVLLVRLVFCFFADDTRIFENDTFKLFISNQTKAEGTDLGAQLSLLFQVLNTPKEKRQANLDDDLKELPYINGHLFEERINIPVFTTKTRELLVEAVSFDWSRVSPAIFGSMFQSVMDEGQRHDLGAHYTSEKNILKLIGPLFLDQLQAEFEEAGKNKKKLEQLHDKIAKLTFLDPACGCGNFLVVSYRELRRLELGILERLHVHDDNFAQTTMLNMGTMSRIDVDCMYGIEIEEFPARIAELALWLTDHQMNTELGDRFGVYYARLPLNKRPNIHYKNALATDWETIVPKERLSYILGNPPFLGSRVMTTVQKDELRNLFAGVREVGFLDYVTAWYQKAAELCDGTSIKAAFVSTNSISQGEQVGILWSELFKRGIRIDFAHRTFKWSNEATGRAAVYCVIIGFSQIGSLVGRIFEYEKPNGDPHELIVKNINPYLVDGPNIVIRNRQQPISPVPAMVFGNMPRDGGFLIFTNDEKNDFIKLEPKSVKYLREFIGAQEFLHGETRWCLWLNDAEPSDLASMPLVLDRIQKVKEFRQASVAISTRKMAQTASLFAQRTQPNTDYILIPSTSSENRRIIPFGFLSKEVIVSNSCHAIPGATPYHFGVLESEMHMTWMRAVCGRLESRYRYSKDIVYNNFPWPENASEKDRFAVEAAAQTVLDVRKEFPNSTLADLYSPITMPPRLVKAHQNLDKAVDKCYGKKAFSSESERLEFLFEKYKEIIERR